MIESTTQKELIREKIGFLFEEDFLNELFRAGKLKEVPAETVIMDVGDEILYMPFVIDGSIKVSRENESGGELLLYYIESGDTCAITIQCCVRKSTSEVKATTMEDSTLLMIPIEYVETWLEEHSTWRKYILGSYHTRLIELMDTIDAITFMRLDERLDRYLKDQAKLLGSLEINHTHQQIAEDLHSSRVVISRLLKQMEHKGMIKLKRNSIVLKEI